MLARATVVAILLTLFAPIPATAQQVSPVEISAGYLGLSAGNDGYPKGYYVDFVANVNARLGIVVATDGAYRSESFEHLVLGGRRVQGEGTVILERLPVTLKTTTRGVVAGGRFTWPDPRVRYFVQASVGAAHLSSRADINSPSASAASLRDAYHLSRWRAAIQAGSGANVAISSRIGARVGVDYRRLERVPMGFAEDENRGHGQNQLIFTLGVSWMVGK